MNVKQNIGILNALIRITIGLTVLSCASAKWARKPWCSSYLVCIVCSAMKVAEGIVRYCPLTDLIQQGQNKIQMQRKANGDIDTEEEMLSYNPT